MTTAKLNFPTPLTEKYRPRLVEDFIGLHKPRKIFEQFIKRPFESAWLFLGPSGDGKTSMAMAIAEQINAEMHHIASRQCDLESVSAITRLCQYAAFNFQTGKTSEWHAVVVDEADQATQAAQNMFLSLTDETARPPKTVFFFTANSTASMDIRFLSRLHKVEFESDSLEGELEHYLSKVYRKEGGKHPLSFADICKASSYNVRDALNKLEIELMMGPDRSDLPAEKEIEIIEEHKHSCKKCHKPWPHKDPMCELPFRSLCPNCGGSSTVGQERAKKAWDTIRAKIANEIKNGKKKKRKRN